MGKSSGEALNTAAWLARVQRRVDKANKAMGEAQRKHWVSCSHEYVVEAECEAARHGRATPPERICLACGAAEDGWGYGWKKLKSAPLMLVPDRSEANGLRDAKLREKVLKLVVKEDAKGVPAYWVKIWAEARCTCQERTTTGKA